jgi:hypothetical protein
MMTVKIVETNFTYIFAHTTTTVKTVGTDFTTFIFLYKAERGRMTHGDRQTVETDFAFIYAHMTTVKPRKLNFYLHFCKKRKEKG